MCYCAKKKSRAGTSELTTAALVEVGARNVQGLPILTKPVRRQTYTP